MSVRDAPRSSIIDEAVATHTAALVAPTRRTPPRVAARLRADVAADLPALDEAARSWTGLGAELAPTRMRVVSRVGWVRANLAGLRGALEPVQDRIRGRPLAPQAIGVQIGVLLGLLSTKVLGQYVLPLGGPGQAQLVLVGPNVLETGERFGRLAPDILKSVLLHELAHRLQFDSVPWLGDHLRGILRRYLEAAQLDPQTLLDALRRLPDAVRALREQGGPSPLLQLVLTSEQQDIVEEAQALMSLLEGHGNATMYLAADGLVRDPDEVRRALERRRKDLAARALTAAAGLDMKRRQYSEGENFVRTVVARLGTAGLNRAFDAPSCLPRPDEIAAPDRWIERVHGAEST